MRVYLLQENLVNFSERLQESGGVCLLNTPGLKAPFPTKLTSLLALLAVASRICYLGHLFHWGPRRALHLL